MIIDDFTQPQYRSNEDDLYPVFLYEYNKDGLHGPALEINNIFQLGTWMQLNLKRIIDEKVEVRITDSKDLLCFHARNGKILFDGQNHHPENL